MAVGAQIAPPEPAAIATAPMGTEVPGGVHRAGAAVSRGHGLEWHRRWRLGMRGFVRTQSAMGPLSQSCKRFEFMGALASWELGWRDRLARGGGVIRPQPAEHQEDVHQNH